MDDIDPRINGLLRITFVYIYYIFMYRIFCVYIMTKQTNCSSEIEDRKEKRNALYFCAYVFLVFRTIRIKLKLKYLAK